MTRLHCAVYLVRRSTLQVAADSYFFLHLMDICFFFFFFLQWVLWKDINSISITVCGFSHSVQSLSLPAQGR